MSDYKLETYLKNYCIEHPNYMNLYSTWNLNKKTCSELLKTVIMNYPHFSMHDASHSEAILSKMEMLLGDRIQKLSPTDTWLLLHVAYTHDLGMVLKWDELEKVWETSDFQNYLSSLENSSDNELRNAAIFIRNFKELDNNLLWPLKTHRYVNLINAAYFRGQHAQIARRYMDVIGKDLMIDLGHSNLIQARLIKLLGRICEIHTSPLGEVLALDYQTDGFSSDYAHPRFIAMMLRLSDLLDIDNGRFNTACELVSGTLPETSLSHKEKHNATIHLLVKPEKIEFTSDCPNPQAYLETRGFVTWLEQEIDFITKYWVQVTPEDIGGYAPRFNKKELLINGVPDIEGVAGLRFEISQEKAFQIVEGSNIYQDQFVFIREVIQNAMDASKLQMWNDLNAGVYDAWIGKKNYQKLQPYEINSKIFDSYPIQIKLSTLTDGTTLVEVSDRGTGISVDAFKNMCNVGDSNSNSEKMQVDIRDIPSWLRPTAGFGIGLQSIFLITNQFEIDTCTSTEAFTAIVHSNRMGGYIQLQRVFKRPIRGTTIRIKFRMPENFNYSMFGYTENYINTYFDPMSSEDHMGEVRILEAIRSNCVESMIPIRVECAEDSLEREILIDALPVCNSDAIQWDSYNDRYRFLLEKDCSFIRIWDMDKAVYGEFRMVLRNHRMTSTLFKGIEVGKRSPRFWEDGISSHIDIYGLDTKDTISLDRSSFTQQGSKQSTIILDEMFNVYKECVLEKLIKGDKEQRKEICSSQDFNPYTFWMICDSSKRSRIPNDVLNCIETNAIVLVKDKEGRFKKEEKAVRQLVPITQNAFFLNLNEFKSEKKQGTIDYDKICSILNHMQGLDMEEIIADEELTETAGSYWNTMKIPDAGIPLILFTVSSKELTLLSVDSNSNDAIIRGLSGFIPGMNYTTLRKEKAKRHAVPAMKKYESIILKRAPYGIAKPRGNSFYYIISPFNREEAMKLPNMPKESFTEMVITSKEFNRLLKFVLEHSPIKERLTDEKVRSEYKQLVEEYYDIMSVEC